MRPRHWKPSGPTSPSSPRTCRSSEQDAPPRSEEHTSELQSHSDLVCRLLLEKKKVSLEFDGELAQQHGARLIGVFLQPQPTITTAETFDRGTGMQSLIEVHRVHVVTIIAHY